MNRITLAKIIVSTILVSVLGACVGYGNIVDKIHYPEHDEPYRYCQMVGGKIPWCVNGTRHVEERWTLVVESGGTTVEIDVPKDIWDMSEIGHPIPEEY